jgi:hypothetical protein
MFLRFRKRTRIADLAEDRVVVIEGEVSGKKELALPHAGTPCVYFEMITEAYRVAARGRGRPLWLPDGFDRKCSGFFLEDGTGRVWVRAEAEAIDLTGGTRTSDTVGRKGKRRYTAAMLRTGDLVRLRGTVTKPKKYEPEDVLVIAPDAKGRIEILVRRREAQERQ